MDDMRVAIVGSREYVDKRKVRDFIFKCKEQFGTDLEIVSGGQKQGADGYAKKFSLEMDVKYSEFPPQHYPYNQHCIRPIYEYGKDYRVYHYHKRNKQIAEYSDVVVAFIPRDKRSKGTESCLLEAKKLKKNITIIQ